MALECFFNWLIGWLVGWLREKRELCQNCLSLFWVWTFLIPDSQGFSLPKRSYVEICTENYVKVRTSHISTQNKTQKQIYYNWIASFIIYSLIDWESRDSCILGPTITKYNTNCVLHSTQQGSFFFFFVEKACNNFSSLSFFWFVVVVILQS